MIGTTPCPLVVSQLSGAGAVAVGVVLASVVACVVALALDSQVPRLKRRRIGQLR